MHLGTIPIYRRRRGLIHRLTPLPKLLYLGAVFVLALLFENPLYLAPLFAAQIPLAYVAGIHAQWRRALRLILFLGALVVLFNALTVYHGEHILLTLADNAWVGTWRITLEGIVFGCTMALRLAVVISSFIILGLVVAPDELLKHLSGRFRHLSLIVVLTMRLYPTFVADAKNIADAQRVRGVDLDGGRLRQRLCRRLPIMLSLLLVALERAINIGEAMEARAFGAAQRTVYRAKQRGVDDRYLTLVGAALLAVGVSWWLLTGAGAFTYYPQLALSTLVSTEDVLPLATLSLLLFLFPLYAAAADLERRVQTGGDAG